MSRSTDFTLANLVSDVEEHSITTRNRLVSAADFMLKYELDDPYVDPRSTMQYPDAYYPDGSLLCESFFCVKLMSINMIYLEDVVMKSFPNGIYSDEELRLVINERLRKKENDDKTKGKRTHPNGTALTEDMIQVGMKIEHRPATPESSTKCRICLSYLDGPFKTHSGERLDAEYLRHVVGILINCGHEFHEKCITDWLLSSDYAQCPVCRHWALFPQYEYPSWINDLNKVREFLSRNHLASFEGELRCVISVSVLHAIMTNYLVDHGMGNISDAFLDRVSEEMYIGSEDDNDKVEEEVMHKKRMLNEAIKCEVIDFLMCCRTYKTEHSKLIVRFNKFIKIMLEDLGVHNDLLIEFDEKKLDGRQIYLSKFLYLLVQSVVYSCAS